MKNNAGLKHRVASDALTGATTRGRASLGTIAPSVADVPAPPTDPPTVTIPPSPDAAPRAGEKRVRSSSSSSLSTHAPTLLGADSAQAPVTQEDITEPITAITANIGTAPEAAPEALEPASPAQTHLPGPQPAPAEHPVNEPPAAAADTDMGSERTRYEDPTTPEHRPLFFPPPHMTPTHRERRRTGSDTPPHLFEPIMHVFHHDTPALVPNPSQATEETMARLLALRSQRTRKCDPQQALTKLVPTPRDGWSRVYPAAPDFLYTNIPDATLQKWLSEDSKGKKTIVQVMRQNSWCPPQCDSTANMLARTLNAIYGTDRIRVATASEDIRGRSQQNSPFSFLVFGLTPDMAAGMIAKHCFATEFIQFLAYPLVYAATPCFIGSLGGLRNIGDDPSDINNLREDITSILLNNRRMFQALLAYATDIAAIAGDAIMDPEAATMRVLTKLTLGVLNTKTAGGIEEPTINLYLELPASTELDRAFPTFIEAAHRVCFDTPLTGTGRFFPGFNCINCRGITHPTGLCPFESEPEWMAITKPDHGDRADASSSSGAPPPPPPPPPPSSPRNPGPPPRRDTPAPSSRLPGPPFRNPKGRGSGRG